MSRCKLVGIAAAAGCAVAAPAFAQGNAVSVPTGIAVPAAPQETPSTDAVAIAAKLMPAGIYRQLFTGSIQQMMGGVMGSLDQIPIGELARAAGVQADQIAVNDKATLGEAMRILDPQYQQRMRLGMNAMFDAMLPLMEQMDPEVRAGLAQALTARFTAQQLADVRAFYATPSGAAYGAQQWLVFMDPIVMGRMQAQMPKIMQRMPDFIAAMEKATAKLPKPRSYDDLSVAEKRRLDQLLGIKPGTRQ